MHSVYSVCTGILCIALLPLPLSGQAGTAAADSSATRTTAWGHPDLHGTWDFRTLTPLERPRSLGDKQVLSVEEAAAFEKQTLEQKNVDRRNRGTRLDVELAYNNFWWDWGDKVTYDRRTSLIVDPADGRVPALTPEAKARRGSREPPFRDQVVLGAQVDGPEYVGLSERCLIGFNAGPPMVPSAYNNNLKIFQTPRYVVLLNEMIHDARIVPLDEGHHLPPEMRQWMGDPRGHWEGNTLVVDSTNFTGKTPAFSIIGRGAMGTGETLHLIERFTRVDDDVLLYEFTIDDPTTFTSSWTAAIPMRATESPLFEYACHEGNYAMPNMLKSARAVEKRATAEQADP